ncbi:hypothetical protein O9929_14120 [Vibrio lentus]|nr:hypothetical protein [Vibrio lentus]
MGWAFSQVEMLVEPMIGVSIGITWYGEPLTLQLIAARNTVADKPVLI